jgi:hypothetical protein
MRRAIPLCLLLSAALAANGCGSSTSSSARTAAGTYKGNVRCTGGDRFSAGSPTIHYRSSQPVSVTLNGAGHITSWTYVFLGKHNLVIQTSAVHPGDSFTYSAGAHIHRPGRTKVTVTDVLDAPGAAQLIEGIDWASPSTHYIGSGTYSLLIEQVNSSTVRYDAIKVVVKHPLTAPSKTKPIVRRNEFCTGRLVR